MQNTLTFSGYYGSVEISPEDNTLYGRLLFISPLVNYEAETASGLEEAFKEAVSDYLEDCKQAGITPEKPCKGSLSVRLGHKLHLSAAVAAHKADTSLNELIKAAVRDKVSHHHNHY
ncbi:MAG: type II toxin-antitoxin system HicB family antitoxin [Gammaproteobacteria bacterium]|nr:type II toxin-antitoxin system HicB family antitoxin [Gammaproteobacteria bacterium]